MTDLFSQHSSGGFSSKPRCHTKHPVLKLGNGEIVGGSCGSPREGYDIYIGFCYTMKFQHQPYPWETKNDPIIEFQFTITDMCAPKSPKQFRKMVEWVSEQLHDGKRIHVGCIGGHGRTGTFLAALVSLHEDLTDDPIKWVRENHCKKAVESESQIKFLMKHFGCKKAKPTKQSGGFSGGKYSSTGYEPNWGGQPRSSGYRKPKKGKRGGQVVPMREKISHVPKKGSIWG